MYDYLTEIHGISKEICKYCFNREIEVYQDNWEGCYRCWCLFCDPKIEPPQD